MPAESTLTGSILDRYLADRSGVTATELADLIGQLGRRCGGVALVVRLVIVNDLLARRFADRRCRFVSAVDQALRAHHDTLAGFARRTRRQARLLAAGVPVAA